MRTLLAVVALCAAAVAAQEPQGPTFKTGIDLIAIDVAVVDGQGRPVEDLRAPDFTVKIDGQERRVASAELFKVDVEAARRQVADKTETFFTSNLTPPNARMIVLAIDQTNIHPGAIKPVLNAASKFLDQLSPLDEVAFIAYPEPGPRVNFTTDRLKVRLAMQRLVGQPRLGIATQLNIGLAEAIAIEARRDRIVLADVSARECRRTDPAQRVQCEREIIAESANMVQRARRDAAASLDSLRTMFERLALVEGHKSVILISEGLGVDESVDLGWLVALAGRARAAINVLLVDLNRGDVTIAEQPPTETEDRRIRTAGLQSLAAMSRGSLFHVVGTGERIFDRLASEISAYYLLGVEQRPGDERTERRRIDVEVRRRDVTVRSRQAYVVSSATGGRRQPPEEILRDALNSPFGTSGVPLRVTTFAQQDPATGKVQLSVAAEVGAAGAAPGDYTIGYLLVDPDNKVAGSYVATRSLAPQAGSPAEALAFLGGLTIDPGVYTLRFGVVDAEGRRGSVVRDVNAWKLAGEEFALGDLIVGNVPPAGQGLRATVEPHVTADAVAMFLELYSTADTTWAGANVTFELADDEQSPALATLTGRMATGRQPTWRAASGVLGVAAMPPGRYVARASVRRDGKLAGVLVRPFVLERGDGARTVRTAAAASAAATFAQSLPAFDRTAVLGADLLGAMLDIAEKRAPSLKDAMADARAGRYGAAALEALVAGDQTTAAFLRGLDFLTRGQLDQAATQLDLAAGPRREFFPAAFYLGATLAAAGRDRDAAGTWQLALGTEARPAVIYPMIADARLRDGQPDSAIEILKPAYDRAPANDAVARRLGVAYVVTGRFAEAVPVLDGYLTRHPAEEEMLFAAIVAQYEVARAGQVLSSTDRAKLRRYATAYRGPQRALVDKYLEALQVR
jgi:VWFA-related protein